MRRRTGFSARPASDGPGLSTRAMRCSRQFPTTSSRMPSSPHSRATSPDRLRYAATMADDGEGVEFGEPPDVDAIARAVRKSRIAKSLFEIDEPVKLGRYQLLEKVGAG